jgi:LPXTG-site transpeptidase (sortase) family protein
VSPVVNYGLPDRLRIPKLAVDAPVTYMGLTKTGAMAVPDNIADVGWYKNGALPGNKGSAVLAGHIDGLKGEPGVFAHLNKLQKGDTLQVIDSNNSTISFRVKNIQTYGQDEQPSEVFNTVDGVHLNLITCTGVWDSTQHHFLERLVVFTDKV